MKHRTALITAGSIAGVMVAGTLAVGASLGILDATSESSVGKLSAASLDEATAAEPDMGSALGAAPTAQSDVVQRQSFEVSDAGTVTVERVGTDLRLVSAEGASGWTWTDEQPTASEVVVTFRSAGATYRFHATADIDGIRPEVKDVTPGSGPPVSSPPAATTPAPTGFHGDDDDHATEHEDGDDHRGEREDDDEHEGRDWDD